MPPCMGTRKSPDGSTAISPAANPLFSCYQEYHWPLGNCDDYLMSVNDSVFMPACGAGYSDFDDCYPCGFASDYQYDGGGYPPQHLSGSESAGYCSGVTSCDTSPLPSWSSMQTSSPPSTGQASPQSSAQQLCRVCNDIATGNHFGVLSCEACKSFFRRSIRAGARYGCRGSKSCEIDKSTRNRCQHCRLQKCVDVGMNKSAVQEERTPYPQRGRGAKECGSPTNSIQTAGSPTTPLSSISNPGNTIPFPFYALGPTPIHLAGTQSTPESKAPTRLSSVALLEILTRAEKADNEPTKIDESLHSPLTYSKVHYTAKMSLMNIISWAKEIPMYTQLAVEDQMKLIKRCWSDLITLKLIFRNLKFPTSSGIAIQTGEVGHMYDSDDPIVVAFLEKVTTECINNMQDMHLDELELSCLKLISLMNPFIHGLTAAGQKEVEHVQDVALELLETHIKEAKPTSVRRLPKLLLFLGQVKALAKDMVTNIEAKQTLGFEHDSIMLELISDTSY